MQSPRAFKMTAGVLAVLLLGSCRPVEQISPPEPQRITVIGVGDILLARRLGMAMEKANDFTLPFQNIAEVLKSADLAVGNLEGPFCENPPYTKEGMVFRVNPRGVEGLLFAGFDVVAVANNHFGDGGDACMAFSLAHLKSSGIAATGAGMNHAEAHAPAIVERKGVRFAFLAYTYAARNDAPESKLGVVAGRDAEQVRRDVAAALAKAHVVIVNLHDGAEYTRQVAAETASFARAALDAGASVVLGHHPHVPQRIERYNGGWIFYSLGNFVFLQNTPPETRHGLMARLTFYGARLERVEALPVVIESDSAPRPATFEEATNILQAIGLTQPVVFPGP
jgi:poly-gamma-glutamate synthesis protein (capsule biosynthesis protein)